MALLRVLQSLPTRCLPKCLYNLCDNSLRHGVHVRQIRIHCEPNESGCMLIYKDDGIGIPQDKKELIFERGYTTSSGSGKSSGLGLFLARDILAISGIAIKETGVPVQAAGSRCLSPPGSGGAGRRITAMHFVRSSAQRRCKFI